MSVDSVEKFKVAKKAAKHVVSERVVPMRIFNT
jgi:hypothetical protein